MTFYKGDEYLGSLQGPLPPPQKDGSIPYVGNLPADKFAPGDYELEIDVAQGSEKSEEKIAFRLE